MPNIILEIVGTNFANYPFDNLVTFNLGATGYVTAATATKLTVQLTTNPTATGSLTAVVETPLSSGSPVQVAIVALNVVGTVNAANRSIVSTNTLTIDGTGFDTTAANNTVTFNLNAVGTVTSATTTQLTITFSTFPTSYGNLNAVVTVEDYLPSLEFQVATIIHVPPAFCLPISGSLSYSGNTYYFDLEDTITDEDIWGANPTHNHAYSNSDYGTSARGLFVIETDEPDVYIGFYIPNQSTSFFINTITANSNNTYIRTILGVQYTINIVWGSAL
jgi:hypothetical protein